MKIIKSKNFYKQILIIGVPIALQQLIDFLVNTADTVMLIRASESDELVSAASLANNTYLLLLMCLVGLGGGGITVASQYWGKGDVKSIRKITSMILHFGLFFSFLAGTVVLVFPEQIMRLFTNNAVNIEKGIEYLKIMGWSYYFFGCSFVLSNMLRSVEVVKISLIADITALVLNVFLNWVLIFGNLGAPAMGIRGAALATVIARVAGFLIIFIYTFIIDKRLKFRFKDFFSFDRLLFHDIIKYGFPVFFNQLIWGLANNIQSAILGHIDYANGDVVAANAANGVIFQICFIMMIGASNAAQVIVGKTIGEGNYEEARNKANTFFIIGLIIGMANTAMILLLRNTVINAFSLSPETTALAKHMLIYVAFISFFATVATMSIGGIFRGGADTRFCLILEITVLWGIALPVALLFANVLRLPVGLVYLGMKIDEVIKTVVCIVRIRGNKWIKVLTH